MANVKKINVGGVEFNVREDLGTLSTTEKAVGTDINGDIIYEQTITGSVTTYGDGSNRRVFRVDTGIRAKRIVSVDGQRTPFGGTVAAIPMDIHGITMTDGGTLQGCTFTIPVDGALCTFIDYVISTAVTSVDYTITYKYTKN